MSYEAFLADKQQLGDQHGFEPLWMPDFLYPFQRELTGWALRKGRAAIFADCGLGKTPMQLVWAENVARHTGRPVLILTPLAVSPQTIAEADKFDIEARRTNDGTVHDGINVTNYERLHYYDSGDFAGVVCDESSILKAFNGTTRAAITEFMRTRPYRLLCTATAAPNDYVEMGTSSEALGHLGFMDMLQRFFVNNRNNSATQRAWASQGGGMPQWRFRGHAEQPFWRWVCSWARSVRQPSDLGYDDAGFELPPLTEHEHTVAAHAPREGMLFSVPAVGLAEEREERRRTLKERCERVAALVETKQPAVCWCHLNDEGDTLAKMIPDAVQVAGRHSDETKEERLLAFARGEIRVLVTKPTIAAWGLNWQHCAHMTSFASHSFEQYYQSVRRCWRYGQTREVVVDHVLSDGEGRVLANLRRKGERADRMFDGIVRHMCDELAIVRGTGFECTGETEVPSWM